MMSVPLFHGCWRYGNVSPATVGGQRPAVLYLDTSKAEQLLGFRAKTSFEEGLRRTIEWRKQVQQRRVPA